MYVLLIRYTKPLDEVQKHQSAHREYLQGLYAQGKLVCSGPREPRTGGVIIANVDSELEVSKIVADDPYFENGVAEYDAVRFVPAQHDPRFAPFLAGTAAAS